MEWLVYGGACLSAVGLAGIIWSILAVARAKRSGEDGEALKMRMQSILPINIGALMLSILGLGAVTIGLILG